MLFLSGLLHSKEIFFPTLDMLINFAISPIIHFRRWLGEIVRKVKQSSVRIKNPLSALYRGTEYFSLARTFRTAWGGGILFPFSKLRYFYHFINQFVAQLFGISRQSPHNINKLQTRIQKLTHH